MEGISESALEVEGWEAWEATGSVSVGAELQPSSTSSFSVDGELPVWGAFASASFEGCVFKGGGVASFGVLEQEGATRLNASRTLQEGTRGLDSEGEAAGGSGESECRVGRKGIVLGG